MYASDRPCIICPSPCSSQSTVKPGTLLFNIRRVIRALNIPWLPSLESGERYIEETTSFDIDIDI